MLCGALCGSGDHARGGFKHLSPGRCRKKGVHSSAWLKENMNNGEEKPSTCGGLPLDKAGEMAQTRARRAAQRGSGLRKL